MSNYFQKEQARQKRLPGARVAFLGKMALVVTGVFFAIAVLLIAAVALKLYVPGLAWLE